jgi:hypothetical protein
MTDDPRLHILHLDAFLDDGRVLAVHADQRDMRRAFIALGTQDPTSDQLGFPRACAWAYLTRTGVLDGMGWADFDAQTIEVTATENGMVATPVDPTRPAPAG